MKIQLKQIKIRMEKKIRFRRFRIRENMWWTRYRKQSVQRARTDVYVGEYHGRTLLNQDYFKNQHFRVMKFSLCLGNVFMRHGRAENLSIVCKSGHNKLVTLMKQKFSLSSKTWWIESAEKPRLMFRFGNFNVHVSYPQQNKNFIILGPIFYEFVSPLCIQIKWIDETL